MSEPVRIQRKRTKGWKKPAGTVCVTRGTFWGNPFVVRPDLDVGAAVGGHVMGTPCVAVPDAESAVETFRMYINNLPELMRAARKSGLVKITVHGANNFHWLRWRAPGGVEGQMDRTPPCVDAPAAPSLTVASETTAEVVFR